MRADTPELLAAQLGSMVFACLRDTHPAIHIKLQLGDHERILAVFADTPHGDHAIRLLSMEVLQHVYQPEVVAIHVAADLTHRLREAAEGRCHAAR